MKIRDRPWSREWGVALQTRGKRPLPATHTPLSRAVGFVWLEPSHGPGPPAPSSGLQALEVSGGGSTLTCVQQQATPLKPEGLWSSPGSPLPPPHLLLRINRLDTPPAPPLFCPHPQEAWRVQPGVGGRLPLSPLLGAPVSPAQSGAVAEGPCPVLWLLVLVRTAWPGAPPHCSPPPIPPPAHVYPSSSGQGGSGQQDRSAGSRVPAWSGEMGPGSLAPTLGLPALPHPPHPRLAGPANWNTML